MFYIREILEGFFRRLRSFVSPASFQFFMKCRRNIIDTKLLNGPVLAFDLVGQQIDKVGGRYLYQIYMEFKSLGLPMIFRLNYEFCTTFAFKKYKKLIWETNISFYVENSTVPSGSILVTDRTTLVKPNNFSRLFIIKFGEERSKHPWETELPFSVHPKIFHPKNDFSFLRDNAVPSKQIFFAGSSVKNKYNRKKLKDKYSIITRFEALNLLKKHLSDDPDLFHQKDKITILDKSDDRIESANWMESLADSAFFLALPGVAMPLCHNAVESLALGVVPILQYPQYFTPPLEHKVNCLVYNNEKELIDAVKYALRLDEREIKKISSACVNYYESHLALGVFAKELMAKEEKTVTIFVDAYRVRRHQENE